MSSPPRTPGRAVRDAAPVAAALALCPVAARLAPGDPSGPVARAGDVVRIEQRLGVFVEPDLHGWASRHGTLLAAVCIFYVWAHLPLAIGPLVWAWLERPKAFAAARDTFVLAQVLTVAAYLLVPTAPPRLLPHLGFHDTLAGFWGAGAAGASHVMQSPYAALPSGHVVFALVAAGTVVALARPLAVRVLAALYPAVVVGVTVVTANHFLLDAAAAMLVAAVSAALVLGVTPRLTRGVVALRPARATPRRA
jgi:PAP2 superfamily